MSSSGSVQYQVPTYINISPKKDGTTAKITCLNRNVNSISPLKRKLKSTLLPKLKLGNTLIYRRLSFQDQPTIQSNTKNLLNLPIEIIIKILYHLDYISVQKLSRTCRKMYRIGQDDVLWTKLLSLDFSIPLTLTYYPNSLKLYQNNLKLSQNWTTGKVTTRYLQGHTESVYCLDWLDHQTLISGSRDHTLRVWDCQTGQTLRTLLAHDGSVLCLKVIDHKILLTGSSDGSCKVWSLPDLGCLGQLRGHVHSVLAVCWVDGWVVTGSRDHTICVWEGEVVKWRLEGHAGAVNALERIDRLRLASASGDSTIRIWNVETGRCLKTIRAEQLGLATLRFNGQFLLSGGLSGLIKMWDVESGQVVLSFTGHVGMIRSIDYTDDKIVSGSYDRTVKVWDAKTGACLLCFQSGHSNWIYNVVSNKTRIASSGQENRIMVIDFGSHLKPLFH